MSEQLISLLITLAIATIPNVIFKLVDRLKSDEDKKSSEIKTADLSIDTLRKVIEELKNHILYLESKLERKKTEIELLSIELEACKSKCKELNKEIEEKEDAKAT